MLGWFHVIFARPFRFIHFCFYPMTQIDGNLWDWRSFAHSDPYACWIPCCLVSRLWVVQQNLLKPWSFWARRTHWCWFLSLGELGFEALTSLVSCPQCLVLTVDITPSCLRSCQLKLEAICLPSLHALCVICYILRNASPQIKMQIVFRYNSKRAMKWSCEWPKYSNG